MKHFTTITACIWCLRSALDRIYIRVIHTRKRKLVGSFGLSSVLWPICIARISPIVILNTRTSCLQTPTLRRMSRLSILGKSNIDPLKLHLLHWYSFNQSLIDLFWNDWGLYCRLSKKYADDSYLHDTVGTVYTMAPELLRGGYTQLADVWSSGVISFMLLSSSMPFYGKDR